MGGSLSTSGLGRDKPDGLGTLGIRPEQAKVTPSPARTLPAPEDCVGTLDEDSGALVPVRLGLRNKGPAGRMLSACQRQLPWRRLGLAPAAARRCLTRLCIVSLGLTPS